MAECADKTPPVDNDWQQPYTTTTLRELSEEERIKLEKDANLVTEFKRNKLEKEAQKNWDLFYKRNTTKFFKDRHWTKREFADLLQSQNGGQLTLFEVGCGVGNFMFPLLEEEQNIFFYACDFSKRAVDFVKENPMYDSDRCLAFQCDITQDHLAIHIPEPTVDIATMIFVLSAIHPDKMVTALQKIFQVIRPGGCLLFRDYALYDHAMLRFAPGHKLCDNFYVRQDGTRAYYFTIGKIGELATAAGFKMTSCDYVHRQTVNKKEGLSVQRIFVQGKFLKPTTDSLRAGVCTKAKGDTSANCSEGVTCPLNEIRSNNEKSNANETQSDKVITTMNDIHLQDDVHNTSNEVRANDT